jgi:hypothetical protein
MTMSKLVGDLKTFDDFLAIAGPSYGFVLAGSRPRCAVPSPRRQTGGSVAVFVGRDRLGQAQINLIWPLSFFHKIDLIVRFRLAGVRIRGHEEG